MQRYPYLLIVAAVFVADRWTKVLICDHFAYLESVSIAPFVNIVHARNMGGAFGLLAGHALGKYLFLAVPILIIAGLAWYVFFRTATFIERLSLTLVLGGAVGNMYDRILYGYVVDFIDVSYKGYSWPAFNVADSAISVGIGLYLFAHLFLGKGRKQLKIESGKQ